MASSFKLKTTEIIETIARHLMSTYGLLFASPKIIIIQSQCDAG